MRDRSRSSRLSQDHADRSRVRLPSRSTSPRNPSRTRTAKRSSSKPHPQILGPNRTTAAPHRHRAAKALPLLGRAPEPEWARPHHAETEMPSKAPSSTGRDRVDLALIELAAGRTAGVDANFSRPADAEGTTAGSLLLDTQLNARLSQGAPEVDQVPKPWSRSRPVDPRPTPVETCPCEAGEESAQGFQH